jgi:hypothetical protein
VGKATFKADVLGAGRIGNRMLRGSRQMKPRMFEELDRLAGRTTRIMASVAPIASGRLAAEIHPEITGGGFQLISDVKSEAGYSYTGVTRFGHRTAFIYPRRAQALRFQIGGKTIFAKRVRGYHPSRDWVESGMPAVQTASRQSADRVGQQIAASL